MELSHPQYVFLNELNTKFRAFVGGFGSGKTYSGCLDQLIFASRHPGYTQGYFAPTYRDIRDIYYGTMEEAAHAMGFEVEIKVGDKEINLYRGNRYYGNIICRSMDNPSGIVGFKIARAMVDELDTLSIDKSQDVWRKIIARLRLVIPGVENGIAVTTTPEGFKFTYELFKKDPTQSYSMVQASTYENEKYLPPDYIPSLRETYPSQLIEAYIMGEFVNLTSGTVYSNFDRVKNHSDERVQDGEVIHIGMDFNVGQMAACIFVQRGKQWHQVAESCGVLDTPTVIELLRSKYPESRKIIYPDASGKNTSSKGASISDIGLLRAAGFEVRAKDSNPRIKDRVMSVNKAFEDSNVYVNTNECPTTTRNLEEQAYNKIGLPDKDTGQDHQNDAFGYFTHWHLPVVKPMIVTDIRMMA